LLCSLALSCWFGVIFRVLPQALAGQSFPNGLSMGGVQVQAWLSVWAPPVTLCVMTLLVAVVVAVPAGRQALRWHLPAFREASLAQFARVLGLLVRSGVPLPDALDLVERVEPHRAVRNEVREWRERLAAGHGGFASMTAKSRLFPPLFCWLVSSAGEDLAGGLARAAEVYGGRSALRAELLLNALLPSSLLLLGLMLLCQIHPFTVSIFQLFDDLTGVFRL